MTLLWSGALQVAGFGLAHGQAVEDGARAVREVIVTAEKRESRLQDTPLSITAFTADDLSARNIVSLGEIAASTPNLVFDEGTGVTGGSTNAQVFIRGAGQQDYLFTVEPGVGIYVDGVYMARAIGAMMDLIDVERIEVLKGPQGMLSGKNAVGGAINVITRPPSRHAGFRGALAAGSTGRFELSATADLPLVDDRLLSKITASRRVRDPHVRRTVGDGLGDTDAAGLGAQLLWRASPAVEVRLSTDYARRREASAAITMLDIDPAAPVLALWNGLVGARAGRVLDDRFTPVDPFVDQGTGASRSDLDLWGASATTEWTTTRGLARSITAWRSQDAHFANDPDGSPIDYVQQDTRDQLRQFSQELQWLGSGLEGRLDYTVGGLFLHETGRDAFHLELAPGLFAALEALPPGIIPGLGGAGNSAHPSLDLMVDSINRMNSRSYAVFAHGRYRLTDSTMVSGGVRYSRDEKDHSTSLDRASAGLAYDLSVRRTWEALTPRVALEHRWSPGILTYVSVARGYKAGGFNGRAMTPIAATRSFDPEYVWTHELGFKTTWLDGRWTLDGAVFISRYTNLQLLSLAPEGAGFVVVVENVGRARVDGAELELFAVPWPGARLNAGVGYLDARYTRLDPAAVSVSLGNALVKTPKWTVNVGLEQTFDHAWGRLTVRADYGWRSKVHNSPDNLELVAQKRLGLLSGQIALRPREGPLSLVLFGSNLTNARYITNGVNALDTVGIASVNRGRPREWGVRLEVRLPQ